MPRDGSSEPETSLDGLDTWRAEDGLIAAAIRLRLPGGGSALPAGYFVPLQDSLRRAWIFATEMRHGEVLPAHLMLALATRDDLMAADPATPVVLRTRAFALLAALGSSHGVAAAASPVVSPALLAWLQEAIQRTQTVGGARDLVPADLVAALPVSDAAPNDLAPPQAPALTAQQFPPAASSAGTIPGRAPADVRTIVDNQSSDFDNHLEKMRADMRTLLAGVHNTCRGINERMWRVETAHAECRRHISDSRQRTAAIDRRLSIRPSVWGALMTVIAAVAIGATVGLILRHPGEFRLAATDVIRSAGGSLSALFQAR